MLWRFQSATNVFVGSVAHMLVVVAVAAVAAVAAAAAVVSGGPQLTACNFPPAYG